GLGVSDGASQKDIKAAYRKLSKQYHPDQNPGAEDKFKEVSAAYDVIGDPEKRKQYDEVRKLGPMGGFSAAGGPDSGFSFRIEDLGDLFGGLFNRGGRRGGAATGPRRGGGRGVVVEQPCPTCKGNGVIRKPRRVKVRVPAGVADGQRIRLKGRGAAGRNGGPAGDLYVLVHVAPHELFGRRGDDLTITVPI